MRNGSVRGVDGRCAPLQLTASSVSLGAATSRNPIATTPPSPDGAASALTRTRARPAQRRRGIPDEGVRLLLRSDGFRCALLSAACCESLNRRAIVSNDYRRASERSRTRIHDAARVDRKRVVSQWGWWPCTRRSCRRGPLRSRLRSRRRRGPGAGAPEERCYALAAVRGQRDRALADQWSPWSSSWCEPCPGWSNSMASAGMTMKVPIMPWSSCSRMWQWYM
jgi:hypothetical protein